MSSSHREISSILKSVEGVLNVSIDTQDTTATVTFDDSKTNVNQIVKALEKRRVPPYWKAYVYKLKALIKYKIGFYQVL
jgi:copper chaperone CopZ